MSRLSDSLVAFIFYLRFQADFPSALGQKVEFVLISFSLRSKALLRSSSLGLSCSTWGLLLWGFKAYVKSKAQWVYLFINFLE